MSSNAKTANEFMKEILDAFESMSDALGASDALPILRESHKRIEKYGFCPFADHLFERREGGSLQDAFDSYSDWFRLRETLPV